MVAVPLRKPTPSTSPAPSLVEEPLPSQAVAKQFTLRDFEQNPPEHQEWVDGQLIETNGMTILHVRVQGRIVSAWNAYASESGCGGEAVPEAPCRTLKQGRRPDVAYMTPELLADYGSAPSLPQCYPLVAEVASPDDSGEALFAKAEEYFEAGCLEVWLVYPEARLILVKRLGGDWRLFLPGQEIATGEVLGGFAIAVEQLLA